MSTNKCEFWMSNDTGNSKFMFPVLPEQIKITCDNGNETVSVAGLGEVTIIQDPSAKVFEFQSHFPAVVHQGIQATIRNKQSLLLKPQEYVDLIEQWIASRKPVKFTVTDPKIGLFCSIENFTYHEQGGDPGTLYFNIKLKEYREVKVRKIDLAPTMRLASYNGGGAAGGGKTGKVKTKGSRLKMYKKKSSSSKVLKKIKNGSTVAINSKSGSWYNISYGGKTGWAKKKYIK